MSRGSATDKRYRQLEWQKNWWLKDDRKEERPLTPEQHSQQEHQSREEQAFQRDAESWQDIWNDQPDDDINHRLGIEIKRSEETQDGQHSLTAPEQPPDQHASLKEHRNKAKFVINRILTVRHSERERYFLRLLFHHMKEDISYKDMQLLMKKRVNVSVRHACEELIDWRHKIEKPSSKRVLL